MKMTKLDEQKLAEEIRGLKAKRYFDILKGIALVIGSIVLFIVVQMPESILNKKVSQESINRDRAKLIIELIHNNNNFENIILELSVVAKAYPNDDTLWITEIKNIYETKIEKNTNRKILESLDTTKNKRLIILLKELDDLFEKKGKLQDELVWEISGKGITAKAGKGPAFKFIQNQIAQIDEQISNKHNEIRDLKN